MPAKTALIVGPNAQHAGQPPRPRAPTRWGAGATGDEISLGWLPTRPVLFFSPASYSAKRERRAARGAIAALAWGPLVGLLRGAPVVSARARGAHVTRYLELWSLRRVVFISGVQTVLTKPGSKSSAGEGPTKAQTGDHRRGVMSRAELGPSLVWCTGAHSPNKGRPRGAPTLPNRGASRPSLSPEWAGGVARSPVKGRLKRPPREALKEGYVVRLAEEDHARDRRATGPRARVG